MSAAHDAPDDSLIDRIEGLLGLGASDALRYADRRRGQRRTVQVRREGSELRLSGLLLAGDTRAEAWLKALLLQELSALPLSTIVDLPGS